MSITSQEASAKKLPETPQPAQDDPDSVQIRATVRRTISGEQPKKGGILSALRRSPLTGADLALARPIVAARVVDL